jgi:hypothetical protein
MLEGGGKKRLLESRVHRIDVMVGRFNRLQRNKTYGVAVMIQVSSRDKGRGTAEAR